MILSLRHDALIVGGGLAGSALAIHLANAGRQAILIEKSKEAHHKVCGEFLSPESLPFLRQIGIHPEQIGAQTIHSVRVAARDVLGEVLLPAPALSLSRRLLDEALLQQAQQAGVNVLRGYTAESLLHQPRRGTPEFWRLQITNSERASITIQAPDAFLATGKHDLRGWTRPLRGTQSSLVAFKMHFALSPEQQANLAGHIELFLYAGGYAGLQLVEDGANLCTAVTREKLQSLGGHWDHLLDHMCTQSPHLAQRLSGARPMLERPLAISPIPYGYCARESLNEPSPWRLGDQAAVIPSFSGDGMSIAIYTAHRAAQLYLEGSSPAVYHRELRRHFRRHLYFATLLSRMIIAIPSVAHAVRLWPSVLTEIFSVTRVPGEAIRAARP
ncbi:MAG TPA: FAD-dependent monooxygenase [Terracidiphilus sp.]|jgi:flavin-dependent dehydrogenase|nr:FAD-dependent monooxygenase [Terracidiphilus sp.]